VTLPEKVYLAMVLIMFFGFMFLLFALSWQDAKETRVRRRREALPDTATQPGMLAQGQAAAHH
jgi:hypothetical protein